ncbi:hypothetical protein AC249_AIPGENE25434 [Exaiptasia diaphana]|nr:hypothetical protein AC249_AIPGENE25434 [Exaiptasia diaphana]
MSFTEIGFTIYKATHGCQKVNRLADYDLLYRLHRIKFKEFRKDGRISQLRQVRQQASYITGLSNIPGS